MTTKVKRKKVIEKLNSIPDNFLDEIYVYLEYFKLRKSRKDIIETTFASESILAKDWLKPEEDKAWANL